MALETKGALWLKEGKKGKFMAGNITIDDEEIKIMVFKNDKDGNEKRPDYKICVVNDDEEQQPSAPKQQRQEPIPDYEDSNIPF